MTKKFSNEKLLRLIECTGAKNNAYFILDLLPSDIYNSTNSDNQTVFEFIADQVSNKVLNKTIINTFLSIYMNKQKRNPCKSVIFDTFVNLIPIGNEKILQMFTHSYSLNIKSFDRELLNEKSKKFYDEFYFGTEIIEEGTLLGYPIPMTPLMVAFNRYDYELAKRFICNSLDGLTTDNIIKFYDIMDVDDPDITKYILENIKCSKISYNLIQILIRKGFVGSLQCMLSYDCEIESYHVYLAMIGEKYNHERIWEILINSDLDYLEIFAYIYRNSKVYAETSLKRLNHLNDIVLKKYDHKEILNTMLAESNIKKNYDMIIQLLNNNNGYTVDANLAIKIFNNICESRNYDFLDILYERNILNSMNMSLTRLEKIIENTNNSEYVYMGDVIYTGYIKYILKIHSMEDVSVDFLYNYIMMSKNFDDDEFIRLLKSTIESRPDTSYEQFSQYYPLFCINIIHDKTIRYLIDSGIDTTVKLTGDYSLRTVRYDRIVFRPGCLYYHCMFITATKLIEDIYEDDEYEDDNDDNLKRIINMVQMKEYMNIDLYETNDDGYNMLHLAIIYNRFDLMKYLIEGERMDTSIATGLGEDLLSLAINKLCNVKIIQYLLDVANIPLPHQPVPNKIIDDFDEYDWTMRDTKDIITIIRYLMDRGIPNIEKYYEGHESALLVYQIITEGINDIYV